MSLKDRIKEIEYQFKKNLSWIPTDDQYIKAVASIVHAALKNELSITDAEMPVSFLDCTLDWTEGSPGDTIVKISKGAKTLSMNFTLKPSDPVDSVIPEVPSNWNTATKAKLFPSDLASSDNFGKSIDISDDYVVIGSPLADILPAGEGATLKTNGGCVYVYGYQGSAWTQLTKLYPTDLALDDNFGASVSINSDYIVVGSPMSDILPAGEGATLKTNGGCIYIFQKTSDTSWTQLTKLYSSDLAASDNFGKSVKINSDNNIVVGVPLSDSAGADSGCIYVFKFNGSTWIQNKLIPSDLAASNNFGWSVDINDDNDIIVGAPLTDILPAGEGATLKTDGGCVYIFTYNGSIWTQSNKFYPSDFASGDNFGWAVSITWEDAFVGSPNSDFSGKTNSGSCYVYSKSNGVWSFNTKLLPTQLVAGDSYGSSVYVAGNYATVGAPLADVLPAGEGATLKTDGGCIYIYRKDSNGVWVDETKIFSSDLASNDNFGFVVATKGNYTIAGAPLTDVLPAGEGATLKTDGGSIYSYVSSTPISYGGGLQSDKSLLSIGYSLPTTSLNTVISDLTFPSSGTNGSTITWQSNHSCISNSGVVTPDSLNDIVGTVTATLSLSRESVTKVFSIKVLKSTAYNYTMSQVTLSDKNAYDYFSTGTAADGDYVVVSSPHKTIMGVSFAGCVQVYHKDANGNFDSVVRLTSPTLTQYQYFGWSVDISGDYIIVGTHTNLGGAYIFHRTGLNTWDSGTLLTIPNSTANDYFGKVVSISGDYAVSAARRTVNSVSTAGKVFVYKRTDINSWDNITEITDDTALSGEDFGNDVSIDGDYLVITAPSKKVSTVAGETFVYHRTGENVWGEQTVLLQNSIDDGMSGFGSNRRVVVKIAGDYIAVGRPWETEESYPQKGKAIIYHRTGTNSWDNGTVISSPINQSSLFFGESVDIQGNNLLIGATGYSSFTGTAYIYYKINTNSWDSGTQIVSPTIFQDYFGANVCLSGDDAICGAHYSKVDGFSVCGSFYLVKLYQNIGR